MWSGNWNLDRIVLETNKKKFVPKFSGENWTGGKKWHEIPANIYLFQVNNRNITKRCEVCSVEVKQAVEVVLVYTYQINMILNAVKISKMQI